LRKDLRFDREVGVLKTMDMIKPIIEALLIDKTVLIQFALLLIFFNLLAPLFFKRIQDVLEIRESKTTKLESNAHAVYKQAEDLAEQYKAKIEKTHQDSQSENHKRKSEIADKEKEMIKAEEEKISSEYDERKSKVLKDIANKRITVMAQADNLASDLVDKLTK